MCNPITERNEELGIIFDHRESYSEGKVGETLF